MADPVVISIPHRLGRAEARRRLEAGIDQVVAPLGRLVSIERRMWTGDRLDFGMSLAGQTARGLVDVEESLNSPGYWRPSQSASGVPLTSAGAVFLKRSESALCSWSRASLDTFIALRVARRRSRKSNEIPLLLRKPAEDIAPPVRTMTRCAAPVFLVIKHPILTLTPNY